MTRRVGVVLALVLAGCGQGRAVVSSSEHDGTSAVRDEVSTTTTVEIDRAIPLGNEPWSCDLEKVVVNASSIVELSVEPSVALETWQSPRPEVPDDMAVKMLLPEPDADIVVASISEVIVDRAGDPRDTSVEIGDVQLVQLLSGSFLPELWKSGETVVALTGPWGVHGDPAWRLHAALEQQPDGTVRFLGPCGAAFDDALASVAAARSVQPDLSLLTQLVDGALAPGAAADLHYVLQWWNWTDGGVLVPPMLDGRVRITGVVYVPSGGVNGVAFPQSGNIVSGGAMVYASGGNPFALPVAYLAGGTIDLTWSVDGAPPTVIASIDPALIPAEGGIVAEIDTVAGTAVLRPAGIDEFSLLSGYSLEQLRSYSATFTASLLPDRTTAEPEAYNFESWVLR